MVQPGDWEFSLVHEVDSGWWSGTGKLNVLPGMTIEKTVVCPPIPMERVPVSVRVDWPSDLKARELFVALALAHETIEFEPSIHWSWSNGGFPGVRQILVGPQDSRRGRFLLSRPSSGM